MLQAWAHSAADFLSNAPPKEAVDAHSIQLYFTTLLARESHATLDVSTAPDSVILTATPTPRPDDVEPIHAVSSSPAA